MINFNAPINNSTGYGITSTNIWKELRKLCDLNVFPMGPVSIEDQSLKEPLLNDINNSFSKNSKTANCLKIYHMPDLFNRVGNGKYGVFPFFEIDKLKPHEVAALGHADIVFTTCEWSKKVLIDNGIDESTIKICPLAVDHSIFNPNMLHKEPRSKTYRFINIGKWEIRKSHDLLVEIFNEAFTEEDNVELWMINHNPFLNESQTQEWKDLYSNSKLGSKIRIYDRIPTHHELATTINNADCGIYISRAEGWNNEILETMALDKPIIATNYSAHTAYCTKDNSYLIDVDTLESAKDNMWFDGYGKWAKLGIKQIKQTIEHMRFVYKNNIRENKNGLNTAAEYTWARTAKILYDELSV